MVILQFAPRAGGAGIRPARGVCLPGAVEVSGVKGGRRPSRQQCRGVSGLAIMSSDVERLGVSLLGVG
jgi:hypothetical protein